MVACQLPFLTLQRRPRGGLSVTHRGDRILNLLEGI